MKTLISLDPGVSTGLCVGTYSDTEPFKLTHFFQIEGGVEGFLKNVRVTHGEDWSMLSYGVIHLPERKSVELYRNELYYHDGWEECEEDHFCPEEDRSEGVTVIAEKFTARGGANTGFSYRTKDLEPLRIEGAMLAMGLEPNWVSPPQQYFSGGEGKAKKKQAQHRWLKEKGLYVTGKMVGCDNADDVRSAIAHAIAFLVRQKHRPTIEHYFPKETDD